MRHSQGPPPSTFPLDDPFETESRRLTPSTRLNLGLIEEADKPTDSSNEDFLFHLYRGSELLQDNRVHEAKEELERALHLQPRDSKGQDLLAVVYFRLGLYPRAIQIYEQLRRTNSNDPALLLNLALCYLKTGQPQLARRDLELLLSLNPTHSRAWGYLGLACERMGDLVQAERAFAEGGHHQMAKRISVRREDSIAPAEVQPEPRGAGAAVQELDAGELQFALAEPTNDQGPPSKDEPPRLPWATSGAPKAFNDGSEGRREFDDHAGESLKPDTRDGPPPLAQNHQQSAQSQALNRRPTLIAPVGAPPAAHEAAPEHVALDRLPSQKPPPSIEHQASMMPTPSMRRPVVAVPNPFGPPKSHEALPNVHGTRTLPPPLIMPSSDPFTANEPGLLVPAPEPVDTTSLAPSTPLGIGPSFSVDSGRPQETHRVPSGPGGLINEPRVPRASPVPSDDAARSSRRSSDSVRFPDTGVVLHPTGVALVRTTAEVGFAARLESIRAQQSGLKMSLLERHLKGKPNGESFGGVASPMALTTGEGQLVLAARPGRKLAAFPVGGEMCFVREDVLLGFGGGLSFENGRLNTGEGESFPVVQLRGDGSVLLEAMGEILRLGVKPDRSLSARREVVLGWFGRLVPRALAPNDAPCGQRGLVSFAGEGHVLIASV